jgi:hypothetical protein
MWMTRERWTLGFGGWMRTRDGGSWVLGGRGFRRRGRLWRRWSRRWRSGIVEEMETGGRRCSDEERRWRKEFWA